MPRKCSVINCSSVKKNPNINLFKVPKTDIKWKEVIQKVNGNTCPISYVCIEHFKQDDVISNYSVPNDVQVVSN